MVGQLAELGLLRTLTPSWEATAYTLNSLETAPSADFLELAVVRLAIHIGELHVPLEIFAVLAQAARGGAVLHDDRPVARADDVLEACA